MNKIIAVLTIAFGLTVSSLAANAAGAPDLSVLGSPANVYVSLQGGQGTAPERSNDNPDTTALSGAVGLDFGPIRTELEALNLDAGKGGKTTDVTVIGANVYAEPVKVGNFIPYLGVGAGYAYMEGNAVPGGKNGVIYSVMLGSGYEINESWTLTAGYRYMVSADQRVTDNAGRADDFRQHVYTAGVRYTF